jgi:hypothetical protein
MDHWKSGLPMGSVGRYFNSAPANADERLEFLSNVCYLCGFFGRTI